MNTDPEEYLEINDGPPAKNLRCTVSRGMEGNMANVSDKTPLIENKDKEGTVGKEPRSARKFTKNKTKTPRRDDTPSVKSWLESSREAINDENGYSSDWSMTKDDE